MNYEGSKTLEVKHCLNLLEDELAWQFIIKMSDSPTDALLPGTITQIFRDPSPPEAVSEYHRISGWWFGTVFQDIGNSNPN